MEKVLKFLKWIGIASSIGIVGGLSSLLLNILIEHKINNIFLLPLIFFIVGIFIDKFPEIRRTGVDRVVSALKYNKELSFLHGILKILLTGLVISVGGSAGKEGPCVQASAAFADTLYKKLNLKNRELVLLTGIAGGLGGAFLAPIGAAIFTCEIIEREDFRYINLIPPIIASIMGYLIVHFVLKKDHLIHVSNLSYQINFLDLALFIVAALFCTYLSKFYIKFYLKVKELFETKLNNYTSRLTIAGFLLIPIFLIAPEVSGLSLNLVENLFTVSYPIYLLALLLIFKIFATSLTIGSGSPGGLVIPSICIGSLSGALFASIFNLDPTPFIVLGIATVVSATTNTPLGTIVICTEIFGFHLSIPAAVGAIIGYQLTKFETLYHHLKF
ncbi:Cl- channel voltage-gated family protein [Methanocaldococcus infernus ME]|uniref:Cl-channel voltage-gated family protein n=1 Tax=Methanocaldococcus infernus (strain DSM 11812 / JCM 15783 / ME) TaxID=573063 RepID=D5VRA9_METIM|nr:chloride channel protein [Methanocaldococcus infernus]ADG13112.1 Cl- channel voltage-gated family protein [Methanocaldococcus infernus ME]